MGKNILSLAKILVSHGAQGRPTSHYFLFTFIIVNKLLNNLTTKRTNRCILKRINSYRYFLIKVCIVAASCFYHFKTAFLTNRSLPLYEYDESNFLYFPVPFQVVLALYLDTRLTLSR